MPRVGESNEDVLLVDWLVELGSKVNESDPLATVETSKVEVEIPSPIPGVVVELYFSPGDSIRTGDRLCSLET